MSIIDRQATAQIQSDRGKYSFSFAGQKHQFSTLEKVHRFFLEKSDLDTIKICHESKKSYVHFFDGEVKEYETKRALRGALSRESGGAWAEEKEGKTSYFIEERGWFGSNIEEVSKKQCYQRSQSVSTSQKVVNLGLGILAVVQLSSGLNRSSSTSVQKVGASLIGFSLLSWGVEGRALGTEFEVNTDTLGSQTASDLAALADGEFVVTWIGQDSDLSGIFGQRYFPSGSKKGLEFQVNNYTSGNQRNPCVASLVNGSFVVVWDSDNQDGDLRGIFGQRFDAAGFKRGLEFQVNNYTTGYQDNPRVASFSDGGFIVVWQSSSGQAGPGYGIYGQRYASDGALDGEEFRINTNTTTSQSLPDVAVQVDGSFTVVWASFDELFLGLFPVGQKYGIDGTQDGEEFVISNTMSIDQLNLRIASLTDGGYVVAWDDSTAIYGQRYDDAGVASSPLFQISNNTWGLGGGVVPIALKDGDFVVAWTGRDESSSGIFAQRYDPNGNLISLPSSTFQVNSYRDSYQERPSGAALSDGGYVITWESNNQDGDRRGIYGQRYNASGFPVGAPSMEFQVNTYTDGSQWYPDVAALEDGGFTVVWVSSGQDGDLSGIFGQRYDAQGMRSQSEFQVNTYTTSSQLYPKIASLVDGSFVIVWMSGNQDGDGNGIYGQKYDALGLRQSVEFQVNNYTMSDQGYPDVAGLQGGGFVVVWQSDGQDGSGYGIYGQRYASNGTLTGGEFRINSNVTSTQWFPKVSSLRDGGFVVVWSGNTMTSEGEAPIWQRYDGNGIRIGTELQVTNLTNRNTNPYPNIASLNDGSFVIIWRTESNEVFAHIYDASGTQKGTPFCVSNNTVFRDFLDGQDVTGLNDGGFLVTWKGPDDSGDGILARRYDANGVQVGSEFQVNLHTQDNQERPSVINLKHGGFVAVWESDGSPEAGFGIYGLRFDVNENPMASSLPSISYSSMLTEESLNSIPSTTAVSSSTLQTNAVSMSTTRSISAIPTSNSSESRSAGPSNLNLWEIEYGVSYEIYSSGVVIGTFSITGGDGLYNSGNSNTLVIELNDNYTLSDGETVVLFTDVPQDHVLEWDNIGFVGGEECFTAEGVFIEETGGDDYGLLFETRNSDCEIAIEANRLTPLAALLATN